MSSVSRRADPTTDHAGMHDIVPLTADPLVSDHVRAALSNPNTNVAHLRMVLQRSQLALDSKEREIQALRAENANLRAAALEISTSNKQRSRGGYLRGTPLEDQEKDVHGKIRVLTAMHLLWIEGESFLQPPPEPFASVAQRYMSTENRDMHNTVLLYGTFHGYQAYLEKMERFRDEVLFVMGGERSTFVKNIRSAAVAIFHTLPPEVGMAVSDRTRPRQRDLKCLRCLVTSRLPPVLQDTDQAPSVKYLDLPPILFPNCDSSKPTEIFRNEVLIEIGRLILHGEGAVKQARSRVHDGSDDAISVSPNCLARQKGITKVTPGLIATSAVLACFTLSGDAVFSTKGSVTRVDYKRRFYVYKQLLEESLENQESHTLTTFELWDYKIFGEAPKDLTTASSRSGVGESDSGDELSRHRQAVQDSQLESPLRSLQQDNCDSSNLPRTPTTPPIHSPTLTTLMLLPPSASAANHVSGSVALSVASPLSTLSSMSVIPAFRLSTNEVEDDEEVMVPDPDVEGEDSAQTRGHHAEDLVLARQFDSQMRLQAQPDAPPAIHQPLMTSVLTSGSGSYTAIAACALENPSMDMFPIVDSAATQPRTTQMPNNPLPIEDIPADVNSAKPKPAPRPKSKKKDATEKSTTTAPAPARALRSRNPTGGKKAKV